MQYSRVSRPSQGITKSGRGRLKEPAEEAFCYNDYPITRLAHRGEWVGVGCIKN
jgi:hypothetical protein